MHSAEEETWWQPCFLQRQRSQALTSNRKGVTLGVSRQFLSFSSNVLEGVVDEGTKYISCWTFTTQFRHLSYCSLRNNFETQNNWIFFNPQLSRKVAVHWILKSTIPKRPVEEQQQFSRLVLFNPTTLTLCALEVSVSLIHSALRSTKVNIKNIFTCIYHPSTKSLIDSFALQFMYITNIIFA